PRRRRARDAAGPRRRLLRPGPRPAGTRGRGPGARGAAVRRRGRRAGARGAPRPARTGGGDPVGGTALRLRPGRAEPGRAGRAGPGSVVLAEGPVGDSGGRGARSEDGAARATGTEKRPPRACAWRPRRAGPGQGSSVSVSSVFSSTASDEYAHGSSSPLAHLSVWST